MKAACVAFAALVVATFAAFAPATALAASGGWTTFHLDNARDANDSTEPNMGGALTGSWTSAALDGRVYAEPLVYSGLVFVATENNTIYALRETDGSVYWSRHLGTATNASVFPCGNVNPLGITSTPVIDASRGILYAVGVDSTTGSPVDRLWSIHVGDGSDAAPSRSVDPQGIGFNVATQNQRGALALANGDVYVPFGGRAGDCDPYHGFVVGVPTAGGSLFWYETPASESGIWAPSGEAVDASGNVYVATGNAPTGTTCPSPFNHSNTVERLSPTLAETGYFAPSNWCQLTQTDTDLGSMAPILLANHSLFISGKMGRGWVLDANSLGNTSSGSTGTALGSGCGEVTGGGAYDGGSRVYVACESAGMTAINVDTTNHTLSTAWQVACGCGNPIIAGGYVWSVDEGGGSVRRFDSNGNMTVVGSVSGGTHFTTPSADSGRIFVAGSNAVREFNFSNVTPPAPPPGSNICSPGAKPTTNGYDILTSFGGIYTFGSGCYWGNLIDHGYPGPASGLSTTPDGRGYQILTTFGGIYTFGDAQYYGNLIDHGYPGPAVALSGTPTGRGYAILTDFGGVYTFGDAQYYGNLIDHGYPGKAVSISYSPSGRGYAILTDSGALYTFGDAQYYGNLLDHHYPGPAASLSYTRTAGYEILTSFGGIYTFGDAQYYGNLIDHGYPGPGVSLSNTP